MAGLAPPVEILPHRPPFLFIDRVIECTENKVVAVRTFRSDEDFFRGHFPGNPIVPGVLLLEAMAQTMAYLSMSRPDNKAPYLVGIDRAKFRKPVRPGQQVTFTVEIEHQRMGLFAASGEARVDGALVAEARLKGMVEP